MLDVRRYNGSYLSCSYAPQPPPPPQSMNFTTFMAHTGDLKSGLKLQAKDC